MQANPIQILGAEFTERSQRNPRYSLRAFARSLGLSHTVISLVLSGKRPLSKKAALIISEKLCLSPEKSAALIQKKSSGPGSGRHASDYEFIDLDTFHLISDWVHYAILSLLEITETKFEPKFIAQRLGINSLQAKVAMDRLVKIGLVAKIEGKWRQTGKPIKVENGISTAATRKFQRQLLEKAMDSLENDPMEARDISSITLAMDPKLVPYAKERIRQFRRELSAELEAKGRAKEVYNLTVQIYPVSREGRNK